MTSCSVLAESGSRAANFVVPHNASSPARTMKGIANSPLPAGRCLPEPFADEFSSAEDQPRTGGQPLAVARPIQFRRFLRHIPAIWTCPGLGLCHAQDFPELDESGRCGECYTICKATAAR